MPSKKATEQALTWLKSKMAERDTLDAINAELCYNVIMDLKNKKKAIGALYHQTHVQNRQLRDELEEANCVYPCDESQFAFIFAKNFEEG